MAQVYPNDHPGIPHGVSPPRQVTSSPTPVREPLVSRSSQHMWWPFARVATAGWVVLLFTSITVGVLITGPLQSTWLVRWDRRVPIDLAEARTEAATAWSHYGSLAGDTLTVIGVAFAVGLLLLVARHWASVLALATALLCEVSVFVATTIVVPRPRPDVEQLDVSPPTSSFPSGHTAAATTLALTLALIVTWHVRSTVLRVVVWALAIGVGPVVGISRIYRGMHHPLDVAMGLLLGVGCVLVAVVAVRAWAGQWWERQGEVTGDERDGVSADCRGSHEEARERRLAG